MQKCECLDHDHEGKNGACTACGDCCIVCGDISSGAAFHRCEHRDFTDSRDSKVFVGTVCFLCGGYDGEHDWEVHGAELRAG